MGAVSQAACETIEYYRKIYIISYETLVQSLIDYLVKYHKFKKLQT